MSEFDPTKPTVVLIRSLPRAGSHYLWDACKQFLMGWYPETFVELPMSEPLEVMYPEDTPLLMAEMGHGRIVLSNRVNEDRKDEGHRRVWLLTELMNQKKSFAFKMFYGNPYTRAMERMYEKFKEDYNFIRIDLLRRNIVKQWSSTVIANENRKWVHYSGGPDELVPVEADTDFYYLDYTLMFDHGIKYMNDPNKYEHVMVFEDILEEPTQVDALFGSPNFHFDPSFVPTPRPPRDLIVNYDDMVETIVKVLDRYEIKYTRKDDDVYLDLDAETFDINLDIPGWTSYNKLYFLAKIVKGALPHKLIVELGTWCGRSAYVLANNRKCEDTMHVMFFDWFASDSDTQRLVSSGEPKYGTYKPDQRVSFEYCVENVNNSNNVSFHRGNLLEKAKVIDDDSVFMAFVDAGHTYEATRDTLELIYPKLCRGYAMLVIDDYWEPLFPDAVVAIHEFCEKYDLKLANHYGDPSLAVIRVSKPK
jgi:hypothetical protein